MRKKKIRTRINNRESSTVLAHSPYSTQPSVAFYESWEKEYRNRIE